MDVRRGRPWPLGVTLEADGANVAVWAPEATAVELCVFDGDTEERIPLPFRDGGVWHAHVSGIQAGDWYGFRAHGPHRPADGLRFNPHKLLLDPYARALEAPLVWDPLLDDRTPAEGWEPDDAQTGDSHLGDGVPGLLDERDSAPVVPKCFVVDHGRATSPDPFANRPGHDLGELVIYEAHLKGLTATHPDVPQELRGTYAGAAHPAILEHLTGLGVNAVEFLPLQAFLDDRFLVERGLTNYWGYQPVAWLAPEPRYARADADAELRALVHALHAAGISVIVDVVFNHTGEGDATGPTLAHRGLHARGYHRLRADGGCVDDTGTGNTVAADEPMVLRLILDSLRHWVRRYGIDGFRFDLATTLGRTRDGFRADAAFFQALAQDPVLAGTHLIAEPWDLGPDGYRLGGFPAGWSEWNDRFRDGVRRVWRGATPGEADLGSLLLGTASHFDHGDRAATASVNFVTAHDGFTLADVVSYSRKHNEANGEDGRDGHEENLSDNLGVEGPTDDPAIRAARGGRVRAMLATLLVSQGVPMLLAGDEIGNSQDGNNNAYAQDGPIGWLDWSAPDRSLQEVVRLLIDVRRRHPVLRQRSFLHGRTRSDGLRDIVWLRPDGTEPAESDWHDPTGACIVAVIRGAADDPEARETDDCVLLILNTGEEARDVQLPDPGAGYRWDLEIETAEAGDAEAEAAPADSVPPSSPYVAAAQSVVVFAAVPADDQTPTDGPAGKDTP